VCALCVLCVCVCVCALCVLCVCVCALCVCVCALCVCVCALCVCVCVCVCVCDCVCMCVCMLRGSSYISPTIASFLGINRREACVVGAATAAHITGNTGS
jgi:hypothetical protein